MPHPRQIRYDHFVYPYNLPPEKQPAVLNEAKKLRNLSHLINLSLIAQQVISFVAFLSALLLYGSANVFLFHKNLDTFDIDFTKHLDKFIPYLLYCFIYITYMFIPLMIIVFALKQNPFKAVPFRKIRDKKYIFPAVAVSLALSVAGSFLANYLQVLLRTVHLEATSPDFTAPTNPPAFALYFLQICILAPLLEEFLFRGAILQNLKKYGGTFAVVTSALLFAMIHGNLIQIPFAFIVGLGLGFFVLEFDSIWIGVLIHFTVNTMSVLLDSIQGRIPADYSGLVTIGYLLATIALGAAGIIIFVKGRYFRTRLPKYRQTLLPGGYTCKKFYLSASFIVLAVVIAFNIVEYLKVV